MIKKVLVSFSMLLFVFLLASCGPNNVPVEWIDVTCSSGEIYVGDVVDLDITFMPTNASNQGYSLSIDNPSVVNFVSSTQVVGLTAGHAWITVTSDDGGYTNQCEIYVSTP